MNRPAIDFQSRRNQSNAATADAVGAIAAGTLAAQRFIDELRNDQAVPAEALERLQQVQIEFGLESPAVRAFVTELAKRASR